MTRADRFELEDVPCTALVPPRAAPVCLFLNGGGGTAEDLFAIAPLLDGVDLVVACATVPPLCFYLDRWEDFVATALLSAVRARYETTDRAGLVGISMGGYGALRIAFARPHVLGAVAAVAPMIEPSLDPRATRPRNRFHYPPEVPAALRSAEHPGTRALSHADAIRAHDLAIAIDAGSRDALNAHDGAEALHRLLWGLDIAHEYHLHRDADHVGPTIAPRLSRAFRWVAEQLGPRTPPHESERALRTMIAAARARAAEHDPTLDRTYGLLE